MAVIISGKELSKKLRSEMKEEIIQLNEKYKKIPHLVVVLVGEDPASVSYVTAKERGCKNIGMNSTLIRKPDTITQAELLSIIDDLNNNDDVTGILVQLPLPKHIDEQKVIEHIKYEKDVDGFHPINVGNLQIGLPALVSCTPQGIITMLKESNIDIVGKHAVIVGRSNIVGKPMAQLLLKEHATVTICHSRTKDLGAMTRQADILIAAVGRAKIITEDMVSPGTVVIDVGVNRVDGKLVGDVDYDNLLDKASYITPVPGGVGPMTITTLLANTIKAFRMQNGENLK